MLKGVKVIELIDKSDERGSFAELFRQDWGEAEEDRIKQINRSISYPGKIRAWHRHLRGQVDYIFCLKGDLKVCIYDDRIDSESKGQLDEIIIRDKIMEIIRIPGFYWHGTKCIGNEPCIVMYFVTKLYDYKNPDEERRPGDDPRIIDPRTGKKYEW